MSTNNNTTKSKRVVLVTGGTGLVGWGIRQHVESHPELYSQDDQWIYLSSKEGNLLKKKETRAIFEKYRPTHVIHLAALVGGLFSNMKRKLDFYEANSKINSNVLACCHEFKVQKCVSCLSTCIFPDKIEYPLTEDKVHQGPPHPSNEGYAYAKRMLEVQSRLYHEQYGCNFVTVIPTNIFGPHDNFNIEDGHVLPGLMHKCYKAMKSNTDFVVWGSGKPLRQFIYSEDLGALMVWVLDSYSQLETIILSVGEEDEISIADAAKLVVEGMGFKGNLVFDTSKADGQYKKTASNDKLKTLNPTFKFTPMKEAITKTAKWFVDNYETARK